MHEYKVIDYERSGGTSRRRRGKQLQDLIRQHAVEGWYPVTIADGYLVLAKDSHEVSIPHPR